MSETLRIFWLLVIAHAVTDYPLQGRFIAEHKGPGSPTLGGEVVWPFVLSAHALINAGGVYLVTGSVVLSMAEAAVHWLIDLGKCRMAFGFAADQGMHVAFKLILAAAVGLELA